MSTNEYKLRVTVQQSEHSGCWLVMVEGVQVASAKSQAEAQKWADNTWSVFPGDTIREIAELLDSEVATISETMRDHYARDRYYDAARSFQRIAEWANAGLRVALLTRGVK